MVENNYLIISAISILYLIVAILHLHEIDLFSKNIKKQFELLVYFILMDIIVDTLFFSISGNKGVSTIILYILKAIEFSLNTVIPLIAFQLFHIETDNDITNKTTNRMLIALVSINVVNIIMQIISIFAHFMFTIDENNIYHRSGITIIYAFSIITCVALLIFGMSISSLNKQNTNLHTLIGFGTLFCMGFILRFIYPNTNFDWLCTSISIFVLIAYYYSITLRLDSLTQLLNRHVYTHLLERINYTTLILIIDANDFKKINDQYGHECGDKTLKLLADCILKAYSKYAYCFRIGGDEFSVILKPNAFKHLVNKTPNSDVYLMAENFMKRLYTIIESINKKSSTKDSYLKYGVSQGYGIYYLSSEYPNIKNNLSLDRVIRLADRRMYRKKRRNNTSKPR